MHDKDVKKDLSALKIKLKILTDSMAELYEDIDGHGFFFDELFDMSPCFSALEALESQLVKVINRLNKDFN